MFGCCPTAGIPKKRSKPTSSGPGRDSPLKSGPSSIVPARRARPSEAEMPLADASGDVARPLEQRGERQASLFDQQRVVGPDRAVARPGAPAIAASQQVVAAGRADRRRRVPLGESHPFPRQPVDVRRPDLRRAIAADIAVAEVVGENNDDVGPPFRGRGKAGGRRASRSRTKSEAWRFIGVGLRGRNPRPSRRGPSVASPSLVYVPQRTRSRPVVHDPGYSVRVVVGSGEGLAHSDSCGWHAEGVRSVPDGLGVSLEP